VKDELKVLEGTLFKEHRVRLESQGQKPTEALVKSEVYTDTRFVDLMDKLREVEHNTAALQAVKLALDHKRDMLIQLGGIYKRELDVQAMLDRRQFTGEAQS
jgi:hypothetical protein